MRACVGGWSTANGMADARATAVARAEKLLDVYTEQIKIGGQLGAIREQLKTTPTTRSESATWSGSSTP